MSNPEKMKVDDETENEKKDSSDEQWSGDEESAMREIVLGLPALSISSATFGVSSAVDEEAEALLNEQAVVAAELVIAAAAEAVMKEKSDGKKEKVRRQRKNLKNDDEAGGSGKGGEVKKPRRKTSEFTNLPRGPPVCNVCGRGFHSWKAVFGHLRSHKDRNYRGYLPPPIFTAPIRGVIMIPGPNSAFVRVVPRGESSGGVVPAAGGVVASGSGGATGGEGGKGLGIDVNVDRVEEGNEEVTESGSIAKFDLNKSPPKEDEEEEEDKAK
ncbi:unnamed protein product [Eruca vesicaria subsp. sativa]|uniref:C2H2-type domain-containing protein n=1 Tax=Eruca vesicaria subsp. sativa TaxID=29727 RepID=A0ABC8K4W9_ERUVS|nr:unnamed protein product [Eruca vesicaria subsp. sativa]